MVDLGSSLGSARSCRRLARRADHVQRLLCNGGALGNVGIEILPSDGKLLSTSSIPLLWNTDISDPTTRADAGYIAATAAETGIDPTGLKQGCGDFTAAGAGGTAATPAGYNALFHGFTPTGSTFGAGNGLPGFPDLQLPAPAAPRRPPATSRSSPASMRSTSSQRRRHRQRLARPGAAAVPVEPELAPGRVPGDPQRRGHGPADQRAAAAGRRRPARRSIRAPARRRTGTRRSAMARRARRTS